MNNNEKKEERKKEEQALLTFLKRTKDGQYAKIDEKLLLYPRVKEQREEIYTDEEYYYSVR